MAEQLGLVDVLLNGLRGHVVEADGTAAVALLGSSQRMFKIPR
jgi:hypothetical protein